VDTKSEASCAANDITRQIKKYVYGKDARRMCEQSPFCRKSTPLVVVSRAFAVVSSWMFVGMRCPVLQEC